MQILESPKSLDGSAFASFDIEELEVLELSDSVALPEMGASWGGGWFCCSSSSSTCSAC